MIEKLPYMNERADQILSDLDTFVTLTQETLKDKTFSLEARWALYLKVEKLLPDSTFYPDHLMILTDVPYDDLNLDRYQSEYPSRIDENIVGNFDPNFDPETADDWEREQQPRMQEMYAKRDEWREAVLQEGYGSFTYDW